MHGTPKNHEHANLSKGIQDVCNIKFRSIIRLYSTGFAILQAVRFREYYACKLRGHSELPTF